MQFEVTDVFIPAVRIGDRELTPKTQPQNEVEARVVKVLKAISEDIRLTATRSQAVAELLLWERIKEVCHEGNCDC